MCSLMRVHRGARAARLLVAERLQKMNTLYFAGLSTVYLPSSSVWSREGDRP